MMKTKAIKTLRPRIMARLDIKGENVVRGIHLEGLRVVGNPKEMAQRYYRAGVDELIFIDTVASLYGRNHLFSVLKETAQNIFVPLTVGGGIRTLEDAAMALRSGADKIMVNSAAVKEPKLIREIAENFGRQCVVCAIEAKRKEGHTWEAMIENGRQPTYLDAVEWARQCDEMGAGEIMITSIDQDGTKKGCDILLIQKISEAVSIPVTASGGVGSVDHIIDAFVDGGADAIALGALLHFNLADISSIKKVLLKHGMPVSHNTNL